MESSGDLREVAAKSQVVGLFVHGQNAKYSSLRIVVENRVTHEAKPQNIAIPLTGFHDLLRVQGNVIDLPRSNAPADVSLRAVRIRRFQVGGCVEAIDFPEDFVHVSAWAAKSVRAAVPNRFVAPLATDAAGFNPRSCLV